MKLEQFAGVNAGYVLELYERYRQNPASVDEGTRKAFESWTPAADTAVEGAPAAAPADTRIIVGAASDRGKVETSLPNPAGLAERRLSDSLDELLAYFLQLQRPATEPGGR